MIVGDQDDFVVQELEKNEKRGVRVIGSVREARFVDGAKKIAAVSFGGTLHILDAANGAPLNKIQPQPRLLRLLQGADWAEGTVYTASLGQISGWDVNTGKKVLEIPTELSRDDSARRMPSIVGANADSDWYLIFDHDRFYKRPTKPVEYASKIAPRTLTSEEQNEYIFTVTPDRQ